MANSRTSVLQSRVKLAAGAIALLVLVLFVAFNFEEVEIDLILFSPSIRLGFALLFTALLGFLVGFFFPQRFRQ